MSSGVESGQRLLHGGLRAIENQWVFSCECVSNASLGIFCFRGNPPCLSGNAWGKLQLFN